MSTYTVDITLGSDTFTVTSADDPADPAVVWILDGLSIRWENPENAPTPCQPDPVGARLGLMTYDKANLIDLDIGTPAQIIVTSSGTTVATFNGRVGDVTVTPTRYNGDQVLVYSILLADYTVDLAELPISASLGVENLHDRFDSILAAIAAADGPSVTVPFFGTGASFESLDVAASPALAVLDDHLRQLVASYNWGASRYVVVPTTVAGVLTGFELAERQTLATTWGPGRFALVAGVLVIVFDAADPVDLDGWDMGLVVDGCRVPEDVSYRLSKFGAPNTVAVTWSGGEEIVSWRSAGDPAVTLRLTSTWTDAYPVETMGVLYLPIGGDVNRWSVEGVSWEPTDAELAGLPFPLTPDTDTGNQSCYTAQVVVTDVPPAINPANDSPFYAGTLDGVEVRISGGKLTANLTLARRIAAPYPLGSSATDFKGVRPVDVAAEFPAVKVNQVDPTITVYETRLVRRPA